MGRRRALVPLVGSGLLAGAWLLACGVDVLGTDVPPARDLDASIDGAVDRTEDAGVDARTSNPEGAADAISDAPSRDPDLPAPTPGIVTCGLKLCTADTQLCCGGEGTCEGNPAPCGSKLHIRCDEPADCPGKVCCLGENPTQPGKPSSMCVTSCPLPSVKVCRTSADCPGTACVEASCIGRTFGICSNALPAQCDGG